MRSSCLERAVCFDHVVEHRLDLKAAGSQSSTKCFSCIFRECFSAKHSLKPDLSCRDPPWEERTYIPCPSQKQPSSGATTVRRWQRNWVTFQDSSKACPSAPLCRPFCWKIQGGSHFQDVTRTTKLYGPVSLMRDVILSHIWAICLLQPRYVKSPSLTVCFEGRRFQTVQNISRNLFCSFPETDPSAFFAQFFPFRNLHMQNAKSEPPQTHKFTSCEFFSHFI